MFCRIACLALGHLSTASSATAAPVCDPPDGAHAHRAGIARYPAQNIHGLLFQIQAARNLFFRQPEEAVQNLDSAITMAEDAIDAGRDTIQGLRSGPMAKGNIAELLRATSQELADTGTENSEPPAFELIEEGERQALSANTKNEICHITLEILRNAYRHARAHRVEAEIRYGEQMFSLEDSRRWQRYR